MAANDVLDVDISDVSEGVNQFFRDRLAGMAEFSEGAWLRFERFLTKMKEVNPEGQINVIELMQAGILDLFTLPTGSEEQVSTSTFLRVERGTGNSLKLTAQAGAAIGTAALEVERTENFLAMGYVKFDTLSKVVIGTTIGDKVSEGSVRDNFLAEAQIFLQAFNQSGASP